MKSDYTVEIWRIDGRYKEGKKFIRKHDYIDYTKEEIENRFSNRDDSKFEYKIFETWVTRTHLLTGEPFKERYDTPHYCSPSSETFWSS
jgi:collagenase-like PrtC family protease